MPRCRALTSRACDACSGVDLALDAEQVSRKLPAQPDWVRADSQRLQWETFISNFISNLTLGLENLSRSLKGSE